jgi:putative membrane protein
MVLVRRARAQWVVSFTAIYIASLSSELAGTTVGLPFGPYQYTDALGLKWFGHVPLLIPLSWFLMAVPSYAMAQRLVGDNKWRRIALASFVLLAWDLALDPAMSYATKYWVWGATGPYYGMPWLNLFGWYVTGLVLMLLLVATRADAWIAKLPIGWLAAFYAINLAMSLGIDAAARLDGAVIASLIPLFVCVAAARTSFARSTPARARVVEA